MNTTNPGQFLARLFGILARALTRADRHHACARWGCLLPVGKSSTFGFGPVCDVCRYGLRACAFPPRLNGGRR
jgi:hypothetical protein